MATVKFLIRGKANPRTIFVRFRHGRNIDFTKSTSLQVNPKYWNEKKGSVKQISEFADKKNLQNQLNSLITNILNSFNDDYSKGVIISKDWFENCLKSFFNQKDDDDLNYFMDYAEHFLDSLKNKVQKNGKTGVSAATFTKYRTVIRKVQQFQEHKNKKLKLIDIDMNFHREFIDFLHKEQRLNYNTTGKYLLFIKTICKDAKRHGIKINTDLENGEFRPTKEPVTFITLSEAEIERIHEKDYSRTPYLENARNWLIIAVWTGARVSDLLKFNKSNIQNGFIEYTAKKTEQRIVLPLHPQVSEILKRLNGNFPRSISSQKFNDYIKEVCNLADVNEKIEGAKNTEIKPNIWRKIKGTFEKWELATSHIGRRSFATNHYGKLPTPVIMAVTGHTTEKMFLNYIGKTAKDNANVLHEFWQMQKQNKQQRPKLNIIKDQTA